MPISVEDHQVVTSTSTLPRFENGLACLCWCGARNPIGSIIPKGTIVLCCVHASLFFTFDLLTAIARADDSDATAEAIETYAGIAPFNSLQGRRIDRH